MDELVSEFLTETNEGLAQLDAALLQLERLPGDKATLSFIFRLVHTIKGTCGFLNLPRLERVAHAAESVLGRIRDGALTATPETVTVILAGLDRIKLIIADIADGGTEKPGDDTEVVAALDAVAAEHQATSALDTPGSVVMAASAVPTIRLKIDVLESLMTLVSELVLTRNQLVQLARSRQDTGYTATLQRLSHITSDLQENVLKTRMQPIGQAWNQLPRLVRDLARDLGKPIELMMHGGETELDRQVLELLRDPLTHMVRNSADHGLEDAATRRAAGKPLAGTIVLNAYHEGGHILVQVSDDGAGLPVEKIRSKALARGLATQAEMAAMSDRKVEQFIFHAGLSTASSVTAVSGRGVGLDVVRTNIERIGGTIALESTAGRGTMFTLKIPLTLAIISALIVQTRGERFAIPQLSVLELVRPVMRASGVGQTAGAIIEMIDGTPVLRLRERLLPLVDLGALLRIEQPPVVASGTEVGIVVVVMAVGTATLGIVVDWVFDTEEIVVKPVASILRHIPTFSGNTILGDGSVIMILDPNGIARAVGLNTAAAARLAAPTSRTSEQTGASTAMLLFRPVSGGTLCAVPLGLVARIENIARAMIEQSSGQLVTQYQGQLMPLLTMDLAAANAATQSVLVFSHRGRNMGLMVAEIIDVIETPLTIELAACVPGMLGSAVIAGRATDVLDAGHWMDRAWQDWFCDTRPGPAHAARPRLLVVEDSAFFRQLVVPALSAAGYHVVAVDSAAKALALQAEGGRSRRLTPSCLISRCRTWMALPSPGGCEMADHGPAFRSSR